MRFSPHFREAPGGVFFSRSNGLFLIELVLNTALPLQNFGAQPQSLVVVDLIQSTAEETISLAHLHLL